MPRINRSQRAQQLRETGTVEAPVAKKTQPAKKTEAFQQQNATKPAAQLQVPNTPNRGVGQAVKSMSELIIRASGGDPKVLTQLGTIGASLRLFAERFDAAAPAQREAIALAALRHHVVHSDLPLPKALLKPLGGGGMPEVVSAYAKDLGFQGVRFDGKDWQLLGAGAEPVKLKAGDGTLSALGRAVNEQRFSTASILPPHKPAPIDAREFDAGNAHLAVHLSTLAYQPKEVVLAQLEKWGYDTSTFRWIENKATDTQGFVVADKQGNVFSRRTRASRSRSTRCGRRSARRFSRRRARASTRWALRGWGTRRSSRSSSGCSRPPSGS